MMKKVCNVLGIMLSILTVILAVLYIMRISNVKLGYCMMSMLASMVAWNLWRMCKKKDE